MKYFAVNEEIERTIGQIKRQIMLSMNGICAENIDEAGFNYRKNFGVSYARLTEIAQNYEQNYELAYRLWLLPIRETKLLATMICPADALTEENVGEWTGAVDNPELAEVIGYSLLRKAPRLMGHFRRMLADEVFCVRLAAYHTLSRCVAEMDRGDVAFVLELIDVGDLEFVSAYRAVEAFVFNAKRLNDVEIERCVGEFLERVKRSRTRYAGVLVEALC